MRKRLHGTAIIAVVFAHVVASLACSDPIKDFINTQAAVRPIQTLTPSGTPNPTGTETNALATANTVSKSTSPAASEKDRFIETAGLTNFSYVPPAGWKKEPASGTELTYWLEPSECCLLHFLVSKLDMPAEQYALASLQAKKAQLHAEVISQGKFINHAGLDAYKVVMADSSEGSNSQVAQYFFQSRGYIIIATYVRGYHEGEDQDPAVDVSMQTLRDE